jgi:hypothetical protein
MEGVSNSIAQNEIDTESRMCGGGGVSISNATTLYNTILILIVIVILS